MVPFILVGLLIREYVCHLCVVMAMVNCIVVIIVTILIHIR